VAQTRSPSCAIGVPVFMGDVKGETWQASAGRGLEGSGWPAWLPSPGCRAGATARGS